MFNFIVQAVHFARCITAFDGFVFRYIKIAMQRYKRTFGNQLHAREFANQEMEVMIACGVLNRLTAMGMPQSYRCTGNLSKRPEVGVPSLNSRFFLFEKN